MPLLYTIGLLLVFFLLLVGEFFVPSGGLLGLGALIAAITSIIIAFTHSSTAGLSVTLLIVASTPAVLLFMVRLWPHTPIGRRMLNRRPGQLAPDHKRTTADGTPWEDLVGKIGTAQTNLLPSGLVLIDDRKLDAVSTGMPIDAGEPVIVIKTHAGRIQVRVARQEELLGAEQSRPPAPETELKSFDLEMLE